MSVAERNSHAVDTVVQGFTEFAAQVEVGHLSDATIWSAKRCLVDAVGCALNAYDSGPIRALRTIARTMTSSRPATLFGTSIQTTPDMAAFVNGGMIRCLDFNDDYFGLPGSSARGDTGPHPSDNIGGVLATAQVAQADGKTALLGIVIAYEVCGQLVDEVVLRANGWDHPIFHSIASSVASGRLLGLSPGRIADAIRLAVAPNICLFESRIGSISNWKGLAGPNGSRNGVFAALLAEAGITGPEMAFEGARGFMRQLNHRFSLGPFGGNGRAFRIENTYFKQLPLRYEFQLPVQLALELRERIDPSDIAELRVCLEEKSVVPRASEPSLWRPETRETADHSGPYLIAAALVDGGINEETFDPKRFRDPELLSVVDRIELIEDPEYTAAFPWQMSCRFEIVLKSGRSVTVAGDNPKGHPRNPMSDDDLVAKFLDQVQPRLGAECARQLLQTIWTLEREASLERLFQLMVVPSG
jgi:2-methylcitrate dehydratase